MKIVPSSISSLIIGSVVFVGQDVLLKVKNINNFTKNKTEELSDQILILVITSQKC